MKSTVVLSENHIRVLMMQPGHNGRGDNGPASLDALVTVRPSLEVFRSMGPRAEADLYRRPHHPRQYIEAG